MTPAGKPNCFMCKHRVNLPGDSHIGCSKYDARVTANPHGIRSGWFYWPFNFDPTWLESCNGYTKKET